MTRRLKIRIFPDGRIQAETEGIKGLACTAYIKVFEELLAAETIESAYTPEYFERDDTTVALGAESRQDLVQGG